ncbi:hypothetical protein BRADI_2g37645v3 [Brachypodium distachyon]|uniref:Uncharacterized protein n=1 Tax=Brachypodium distachyon TaxID=15368 RepID=A0A0Q3J531_BRADI|nr:hypothetical protein BRADI_2g37645v3 [Brachypodium distachyon]
MDVTPNSAQADSSEEADSEGLDAIINHARSLLLLAGMQNCQKITHAPALVENQNDVMEYFPSWFSSRTRRPISYFRSGDRA